MKVFVFGDSFDKQYRFYLTEDVIGDTNLLAYCDEHGLNYEINIDLYRLYRQSLIKLCGKLLKMPFGMLVAHEENLKIFWRLP